MTITSASLPLLAGSVISGVTARRVGLSTSRARRLFGFRLALGLVPCLAVAPGSAGAAEPAGHPGAAHQSSSPPSSPHQSGPAATAPAGMGTAAAPPQIGYPIPQLHPSERHLRNLRQLTFGGENAEAYYAATGKRLVMQSTTAQDKCDQIYSLELPLGGEPVKPLQPISLGHGRNTCSYYFPDQSRVLFASTRHAGDECPPVPDRSKGYVWPLYNYQLYSSKPDGTDTKRLTNTSGYEAEATVCHDGSVVFTSDRDGDLELYRMKLDGSDVKRITNAPGYDGGAFFSEDCKHLVWRAARPRTAAEAAQMKGLLAEHMVRPTQMELWVGDADGSNAHAVTELGAASFAPFFFPASIAGSSNRRIIFSSNQGDPKGREFDLWAINSDGSQLERITHTADFDGFPMFSPDGKKLVFASNRNGKARGETNVFIADWQPDAKAEFQKTSVGTIASRVAWLADPLRQGRGVGTEGSATAADEIANWMKEAALTPAGEVSSPKNPRGYFQAVEVIVGVRDVGSRFRQEAPQARALTAAEIVAASMSQTAALSGQVRFAGYGISAPESKWDDLHGLDLKGQVALVLRGIPAGDKLSGSAARSYSDLRYKAWNLREHGAAAVLFVDPRSDGVAKLTLDGPEGSAGLPVAMVSRQLVAQWLAAAVPTPDKAQQPAPAGDPLLALVRAADGAQAASIQLTSKVSVDIKLTRESRRERNVIGFLPARNPASTGTPAVVIGAHYDHLGLGGRSSLAPGQKVVHPGADDNASGTVAMLETARQLTALPSRPFDTYFIAFTGEELGLVGSSRFVSTLVPGLNKDRLRAMLNFDMVGRLASSAGQTQPTVMVQGSDSAEEWAQLIAPECQRATLTCKLGGDGYGPSDMTPFYAAGVPVLFFFTGAHADYHRPTDTADKINSMGIAQIATLASGITRALGDKLVQQPAGLTFKKPSGPAPRTGDRGYGAYLGTIPDYTAMQGAQGGVKLSGARPGSPAEKAGIVAGDTLVGIAESKISTLQDMAFALKKYKPGQEVEVQVLRDGKPLKLRTTLTQRTE